MQLNISFVPTNQFRFVIFSLKLGAFLFCNLTPFNAITSFVFWPSSKCILHWTSGKKCSCRFRRKKTYIKSEKCERMAWLCYLSSVWVVYIWLFGVNNCHRLQATVRCLRAVSTAFSTILTLSHSSTRSQNRDFFLLLFQHLTWTNV